MNEKKSGSTVLCPDKDEEIEIPPSNYVSLEYMEQKIKENNERWIANVIIAIITAIIIVLYLCGYNI
jgi:hypothetical protein